MPHYIAALRPCIPALMAACLVALGMARGLAADDSDPDGGRGIVAAVVDGDTLSLTDGRTLHLAGIMAPKHGSVDEPLADAARARLAALAQGRSVVLAYGSRHMDRHGRFVAQAWVAGDDGSPGAWLQEALLADGLARVFSTPDARLRVAEMLEIEDAARRAGRGLWADPAYRLRTPDDVGKAVDQFQIVEGRAVAVAVVASRGYVNFGADYRTDFTLAFDAAALRLMREAGVDLASFRGHRLRVRGWVRWFNGPLIDVSHPEQIELLD